MKKLCLLLITTLTFVISGCDNNTSGVVDTDAIYAESEISKEAFAQLEEMRKQADAEIADLKAKIGTYEEVEGSKIRFGQAEIEAAIAELEEKIKKEQERVEETVNKAIDDAIQKVKEEANLDEILEKAGPLAQEIGQDVTDQVIDALDKLEVELPELNLEKLFR